MIRGREVTHIKIGIILINLVVIVMGVTGGHFLLVIMNINLNINTMTDIIEMGTTILAMENTRQNITHTMTDAKNPHNPRKISKY